MRTTRKRTSRRKKGGNGISATNVGTLNDNELEAMMQFRHGSMTPQRSANLNRSANSKAEAAAKLEADGEREIELRKEAANLKRSLQKHKAENKKPLIGYTENQMRKRSEVNPYINLRNVPSIENVLAEKPPITLLYDINKTIDSLINKYPLLTTYKILRDNIKKKEEELRKLTISNKNISKPKQLGFFDKREVKRVFIEIGTLLNESIPFFEKNRDSISKYKFFITMIRMYITKVNSL